MKKAVLFFALWGLFLTACQDHQGSVDASRNTCKPECGQRECGDDGCGGSCGRCAEGFKCTSQGMCVESGTTQDNGECNLTCQDKGYECGEVCGHSCGTCKGAQEKCLNGKCVCVPKCTAATCEQPDGCGGHCPSCASPKNCDSCVLRMQVVDSKQDAQGLIKQVTLALDYAPGANNPLPTMADIRFRIEGPARIEQLGIGAALIQAKKKLHVDTMTGKPYKVMSDGTYQVLVFATDNTNPIPDGRWLLMKLNIGPQDGDAGDGWKHQPVKISVVRREETLAPQGADEELWGDKNYDKPVIIWPDQTLSNEVSDEN